MKNNIDYKYDEPRILDEVRAYVDRTYGEHYSDRRGPGVQVLEAIAANRGVTSALEFCLDDVIKYAMRQGRKAGQERSDILKIIHYGMLALYFYDLAQSSTVDSKD